MGAKREYTAIFAIGGRLLGSFRGAMAMAQSRLKGLQATAKRVSGFLKSMAIGMLAGFGTFLAADVFGRIFRGAQQEAIEAEQRTRSLYNALLLNDKLRKAGPAATQKQLDLISQHNAMLEHQGVLHKDILDNMAIQLAMKGGLPSGAIQDSVDVMQNLLVAVHGVNATEEQGTAIAKAWAAATARGRLAGLAGQGVRITKEQIKQFSKLKTVQDRQLWLMKNIGNQYRSVNAAARNTPVGRITLFTNAMKSLSNEIGDVLLPAQADMADAWREFIEDPEIRGMLISSVRNTGRAISAVAAIIKDDLIPVLAAVGQSETFKKLAGYAKAFATHIKEGLDLLGLVTRVGKPFDTTAQEARRAFPGAKGPFLPDITAAEKSLAPMRQITGLDLFKPHVTQAKDFNVVLSKVPGNTDKANESLNDLRALGRDITVAYTVMNPKMMDTAKTMLDQAQAVEKTVKWWEALHQIALQIMATGAVGQVAEVLAREGIREQKAAAEAVPGLQHGGVVTTPTIAKIAEAGPEAVLPLKQGLQWTPLAKWIGAHAQFPMSGARRSTPDFSWLNRIGSKDAWWNANPFSLLKHISKFPMSSGTAPSTMPSSTHVSFAPNITINGNATDAEQKALDVRLRDLARDFVADFQAAQNHERRLSYEGGYS